MKTKMTFQKSPLAIALLATLSFPAWAEDDHGHDHDAAPAKSESHADESHDDHDAHDAHEEEEETAHNHETEHGEHDDEETTLELTGEQQKMLDLQVITLQPDANASLTLTVPAEIISNQYRTWVVPVRIDS